ncbi:MAG: adenylate kinase [Propionibacteriaceae bacterium]|jgi:adenylate kinase|nr:adenylate kinase [Propionibacteriaceae bacterium]
MRLLIMGPPGAGKGTQGALVAQLLGVPAISTGEIFRSHVQRQTALGQQVAQIMARGEYVPDEVTIQLVADRLDQPDAAAGFLLDGFPRTVAQAEALDALLEERGTGLDVVLSLTADQEQLVARMLRRAQSEQRADDNADTIRRRFEVYQEQTADLLARYRQRDLLTEVDGLGEIAQVTDRIVAALNPAD